MRSWGKSLQQHGVFITKRELCGHTDVHTEGGGRDGTWRWGGWVMHLYAKDTGHHEHTRKSRKKVIIGSISPSIEENLFLHLDLSLRDSRVIDIHFLLLLTYKFLVLCYSIFRKWIHIAIVFFFSVGYESRVDSCCLLPRGTQVTPQSTTGHVASDAECCLQLFA